MSQATENRSKWRYEEGGKPLDVASSFIDLLKSDDVKGRLTELKSMVSAASWPTWGRTIREGGVDSRHLLQYTHVSTTVRYPADGMAFVVWPVTHPDHTEAFVIEETRAIYANIVTLVLEEGEWKVHQIGEIVSPAALGKLAYSW
jgi:hypothetical protein